MRVPKGDGLWPALWLLPPTNRSRPEVDVFEIRGSQTNKLSMHVHAMNAEGQRISLGEHWTGQDLAVGWHTFGLDWRAGSLTWFVERRGMYTETPLGYHRATRRPAEAGGWR